MNQTCRAPEENVALRRLRVAAMTSMPTATGLFETHLTVSDLDRSIAFYRDLIGPPVALELPERGAERTR